MSIVVYGDQDFFAFCVLNSFEISVPIHVELRVIHSEIVKITHTFQDKNVHSRTFLFSQKCIENHDFSFTLLRV